MKATAIRSVPAREHRTTPTARLGKPSAQRPLGRRRCCKADKYPRDNTRLVPLTRTPRTTSSLFPVWDKTPHVTACRCVLTEGYKPVSVQEVVPSQVKYTTVCHRGTLFTRVTMLVIA